MTSCATITAADVGKRKGEEPHPGVSSIVASRKEGKKRIDPVGAETAGAIPSLRGERGRGCPLYLAEEKEEKGPVACPTNNNSRCRFTSFGGKEKGPSPP